MIIRAGKPEHFEGPNGIYYQPDSDEIWMITDREMTMHWDGNGLRTFIKYKVWNRCTNGETFVIVGTGDFICLEEL
jgi:hypothetical protein